MNLDRLRALFVQEARIRVSSLVEGLLRVEQGTADEEVMESLLRQTHSLKGSAGLVGMHEVGTVAHELEDLVEAVRTGALDSGADVIDGMLALADRIERLLDAGDPAAVAAPAPAPHPEPESPESAQPPVPDATSEPAPVSAPDAIGPAAVEIERSVTRLPVALHRLDDIVRLAGHVRSGLVRLRAELADLPISEDDLPVLRELEQTATRLQRTATAARTVPVSTLGARLQRAVRDAARVRGVNAGWSLQGGDTQLDRQVLQRLEDALLHMVRNSVAHGLEPADERDRSGKSPQGQVSLSAEARGNVVRLAVADDGRGLDRDALVAAARRRGVAVPDDGDWTALVFRPGLTTATELDELAGRGVGMDVVANAVRSVGGTLAVETAPGAGTTVTLQVPLSLAVTRCLEVIADDGRYALPLAAVVAVLGHDARVDVAEGRPVVLVDGRSLPLLDLNRLVGRPPVPDGPIVVLRVAGAHVCLRVTTVVRQGEITVQAIDGGMPANPRVLGTSIASDGTALVVLDPIHLLQAAHDDVHDDDDAHAPVEARPTPHLLVVDDALTIRELQRSILERAGYLVTTAVDGREALSILGDQPIDLVITDIEMPRIDGFALTETIRQTPAIAATPVLILTTLVSAADRRRGLDAGADGYLLKDDFTAEGLLAAVSAQVGAP